MTEKKIDIYLLAAGEATRWGNFNNTSKHFVRIPTATVPAGGVVMGAELISATISKLEDRASQMGVGVNIKVVIKELTGQYELLLNEAVEIVIADLSPEYGDADKILSSRNAWNEQNTNVFIWADSHLTKTCVNEILEIAQKPPADFWTVSRWGKNDYTGSVGSENFAHIVSPAGLNQYVKSILRVVDLYKKGTILRNGGWEIYKSYHGLPDDEILRWWDKPFSSYDNPNLGNSSHIHDGSEDFDTPTDYENWIKNFSEAEDKAPFLEGLRPVRKYKEG